MKLPKVITIDFETEAIDDRPNYPPEPVGVSILWPGRKPVYYAWGHPVGNNCTKEKARQILQECWDKTEYGLLFHNAKFDLDVAYGKMGMLPVPVERIHETLFLLFLHDPHSRSLSLKPASEKILGMPPEEQEAVRDWLVDHGIVKKNQKDWGAHICKAPGDLVGKYANGDVVRTRKLFDHLLPSINKRGMLPAYRRELQLLPILMDNEARGVRADVPRLERDVSLYEKALEKADNWLRKRLKAPGMNVDSNEELADALEKTGVVTDFVITKTGKKSVSKENLTLDMYKDRKVAAVVGYRNALTTCMSIFMRKWLAWAGADKKGHIYTSWNQVRQAHSEGDFGGARTGRMSSTPPLLNIPKEFPEWIGETIPIDLPPLPLVRQYLIPDDKSSVWLRRDYNQQEYRILGHYEDGSLLETYKKFPRTDIHKWLQEMLLKEIMLELSRKDTKTANFADLYGVGTGKLAERLKTDVATVQRIKLAKRRLMTGLGPLEQGIRAAAKAGEPITTWGGRQYYCEEPKWNGQFWQHYEYKLLNYLIQGSAADCTKEAIIRYHAVRKNGRFLVAVHDELDLSVPKKALKEESLILRDVMKSVEFDVLMLSDGEAGPNWADLKALKEED